MSMPYQSGMFSSEDGASDEYTCWPDAEAAVPAGAGKQGSLRAHSYAGDCVSVLPAHGFPVFPPRREASSAQGHTSLRWVQL